MFWLDQFPMHIVTYAVYVLIVLSLGPTVTLKKSDSDGFLRQHWKLLNNPRLKDPASLTRNAGDTDLPYSDPLWFIFPFWCALHSLGFCVNLFPCSHFHSQKTIPLPSNLKARSTWRLIYLPMPLPNDCVAKESENPDPMPQFGINLEV